MARKLKNRYRLKIGGLTINISLLKEFTDTATDLKMTRASKGK